MKRTPTLFFGLSFLHQFRRTEGRLPKGSDPQDVQKMHEISQQMLKERGLPADFVNSEYVNQLTANATSELSPVCAILGGILGQEVIKVLSGKEDPLSNFFFYNALAARNPGETARIP